MHLLYCDTVKRQPEGSTTEVRQRAPRIVRKPRLEETVYSARLDMQDSVSRVLEHVPKGSCLIRLTVPAALLRLLIVMYELEIGKFIH